MILKKVRRKINIFFSNLQMRIIVTIVSLVFVAVLISVYISFNHTQKLLEKDTANLILTNLEQMGNQVDNICLDMLKLSNVLRLNNTIYTNLNTAEDMEGFTAVKSADEMTAGDLIRSTAIERQMNNAISNFFFNYIVDTIAFSRDGLMIANIDSMIDGQTRFITTDSGNKILKEKRLELLKNNNEYSIWIVPYLYANDTKREERYLSLATQIKSAYSSKIVGIIVINASLDNFNAIFKGDSNGNVLLLNKYGDIIHQSGKKDLTTNELNISEEDIQKGQKGFYTRTREGEKEIVNYYKLKRMGWCIVSITPYDYMMKETNSLRNRIYIVNIIIFGMFILLSVMFIIYFTAPLKKLINKLKKKKIGIYSLGDNTGEYSNDVNGIVKSFDHMFKRIDELVERVIEDQKIEHNLKYETLKAQINPHFLFNTLNVIKWSAMMSGAGNVSNMIADLGMLLEVSMNKGPEEISIGKEIDLVKAYVNIQNSRYDNRFSLNISINPLLFEYRIIKLILQPIIENAFIHGFGNKKENCVLEINGKMEQGVISIEIANNGDVISPEKIEEIFDNSYTHTSKKQKFNGIGLRNIHERLKYKYGDSYGLTEIVSESNRTAISVVFPAKKIEEENLA